MADILAELGKLTVAGQAKALQDRQAQQVQPAQIQDPAALAAALQQLQAIQGNGDARGMLTLAQDRGNGFGQDNPIIRDRQTLNPVDFALKYGPEVTRQMAAIETGGRHVRNLDGGPRTQDEHNADLMIDVGSGLVQGWGSLAQLASMMGGPEASAATADFFGGIKEFTDSHQSLSMQDARYADSLKASLDNQDNQKKFEQEKGTQGEFIATLRSFGRGMLDGADRLGDDPLMIQSGVQEGVGSMLVGGPVSKGVTKGAQAVEMGLARAGIVAGKGTGAAASVGAGARAATKALEEAAFPAAIGMMEAGGARSQVIQEVMGTPHDTLLEQSPRYRGLFETGVANGLDAKMAERRAKLVLAEEAGNAAMSIAGPVGALSGRLVRNIEASPASLFGAGGLARMPADMLREAAEESIQSGVGELAGNIGQRVSGVNTERNLATGVGDATLQGGLFGSMSVGVTQGPGALMADSIHAVGKTIQYGAGKISQRIENIKTENQKSSSLDPEKVQANFAVAREKAGEVLNGVRKLASEFVAPAKQGDVEAFIQKVQAVSEVTEQDLASLPDNLAQVVQQRSESKGSPLDKFEVLDLMATVARSEDASPADKFAAASFLVNQFDNQDKIFNEGYPEFLDKVGHDRPELQDFQTYANILNDIRDTPQIQAAMEWARNEMVVSENTIAAGQIDQATVENVVSLAQRKPQAVDLKVALRVLAHADKGDVQLTPEARRALQASSTLMRVAQEYEQTAEQSNFKRDLVAREIETKGGKKPHMLSLSQHVQNIEQAARTGNPRAVKEALWDLAQFARHMRNKAAAWNEAIANPRKDQFYMALGADRKFFSHPAYKVFFHPGKSEDLAIQVHAEATAVANLANQMQTLYGDFKHGIPQLEIPALALSRGSSSDSRIDPKVSSNDPAPAPVKAERDEDPRQLELPLPEPSPVRQPEPVAEVPAKPEAAGGSDAATTQRRHGFKDLVTEQQENERLARQEEETDERSGTEVVEDEARAPESDKQDNDTVKASFPKLIQPEGGNFFHKAFRFPKRQISRMLGLEAPLQELYETLDSPRSILAFRDGQDVTGYDVGSQEAAGFQALLVEGGKALKHVNKRLRDLAQVKSKSKKRDRQESLLDLLNEGNEEAGRRRNSRMLNILEKTDKGYRYNQQLMETAMVAGLDWLVNATDRMTQMTQQDVAEYLDVDESLVTPADVERLNEGLSLERAVRSLAQNIQDFWGLETVKGVDETYTKGIVEGVAKEILHGLHDAGLLKIGDKIKLDSSEKTPRRITFDNRSENTQEIFKEVAKAKKLLGDLALIERPRTGVSVGEKITEVAKTQLRNPMVATTRQQRKAIENEQNTKYLPNLMVFDFIQALGRDNFKILMGGRDFKPGDLNKAHAKSVEGKNRGLLASFDNVMNQMLQVQAFADAAGVEAKDVPTFYEHQVTRVGRLQMMGISNPQSDKLAREIFMPTRSVLDLSSRASKDFAKFAMTVGQGIGIKTEQKTRDEVVAEVVKETLTEGGKYHALVQELKAWHGKKNALSQEAVDLLMQAGLSMHGVHSVLAVAAYERAREQGQDLKAFESFNYLEADGKTNGPINALMLLTSGRFDAAFLKLVAKGGAFIGKLGQTLNSHTDKNDLYATVAAKAESLVADFGRTLAAENETVHQHFQAFQRVLSALNADVSIVNGDLVIKRGLTKNPLTISIYGSGVDGIAGKVTSELVEAIYEKMSEVIATGKGFEAIDDDVTALVTLATRSGENGFYLKKTNADINSKKPQDFELTPVQFKTLKENVRMFLVNHLSDAVNQEVLYNVGGTTLAVQEATQIQSIVLRSLFRNAIIAKLADKKFNRDKYPDYRDGDFLSDNELNEIQRSLLPYSPFISTGTQSYMMSGGEVSDLFETVEITVNGEKHKISMPESFSRSLSDDLSTPAFVYGPTLAGVRGVPSLVIGSGDGQMMLNAAVDKLIDRTLKVFDGMNMPADAIDHHSERVNQAVYETWTTNPVRAVAESFAAFVRNDPTASLLDADNAFNTQREAFLTEMNKVILGTGKVDGPADPDAVKTKMAELVQRLNEIADDIDIRQQVLREVDLSIDQMASAESPFVREGTLKIPADADENQIADILNNRFDELKAEKDKKSKARKSIEIENAPFREALQEMSLPDQDTGVRVLHPQGLALVFEALKEGLSAVHQEMFQSSLALLEGSGYRVVLGSSSQLDAWEQEHNADRYVPGSNNGYGKIDPVAKLILVSNLAPETVVHELIHAATLQKVQAFYANPALLSSEDRAAVARLEGLMKEWLVQSYDAENEVTQDARRQAFSTVAGYFNQGRMAEAVNEFMAWVLANQNLAEAASRTKVKNKLLRVFSDALQALKSLIWGKKTPRVGDDMLSNLRFNTQVLMSTPTPAEILKQDFGLVAAYHSPTFGQSDRLTDLRERFLKKIVAYTSNGTKLDNHVRGFKSMKALVDGSAVALEFVARGFDMDMQAKSTFSAIQAALAVESELNANSLSRIQDLYDHVIQTIKVEDFMENTGDEQADRYQAQQKYDVLTGVYLTRTDEQGRSSLMSSFLALAMVHDGFRAVLARMDKPKSLKDTSGTLDAHLSNLGSTAMDRLSRLMAGERSKNADVQATLDALTDTLLNNVGDQRTFIEQQAENGLDKFDRYIKNQAQVISEKVHARADKAVAGGKSKVVRGGARLVRFTASVVNESRAEEVVLGITQALNQGEGLTAIRELFAEVTGRNRENAPLFDMISQVRSYVQQTRQQFREKLPAQIDAKFTRPLSKAEKTGLFHALGKTDLAALHGFYGIRQALRLAVDTQHRRTEIRNLESQIRQADPKRFAKIQEKAKQLARFMNTGEHGFRLLRNAYAVAHLFGEDSYALLEENLVLTDQVDRLVTLYAVEGLDQQSSKVIENLIQDQSEGLEFALSYLVGLRADENAKAINGVSRINHYKGYIPSNQQEGLSLIVASDTEHARLLGQGYTWLGAYEGSSADRGLGKRSYYFAPVSGRATFNQGVMQMVHQTVSGVDPETGFTTGELTAGRIDDPKIVALILRQLNNQRTTAENLLPVYNANGEVVAFERGVDPRQLHRLNRDTDLSKMIGVWRGRQVEERLAQEVNTSLIGTLHDLWLGAKKEKRSGEFVDLARTKDPVLAEVWKLIPDQTKQEIKDVFGDGFMVRKDMLNDAVGFRSASVGDLFSDKTRWKPGVAQKFEDIALGIFGNKAYARLITGEKVVQDLVSNAKVAIVVKSVVVPAANLTSNMFQLLVQGVPLRAILKGMGAKTAELNDYVLRREKEIALEAELLAARGRNDSVQIRKLEARIQGIQDSFKRMSIWPLIQAGEFSAISNGSVTAEDLALANGQWGSYVEKLADKVPAGVGRTAVKYALVARDTALFQGLARAVQYGDFLAKAVLYDDLTVRQKKTPAQALVAIGEEFVNYNRLAGRSRNYLESVGLLWFWNFKLRSMKTAANMLRNHPFRALMMMVGNPSAPIIGDIGSPLSDNAASIISDGRWHWSVGPGMGWNSLALNPWANLVR